MLCSECLWSHDYFWWWYYQGYIHVYSVLLYALCKEVGNDQLLDFDVQPSNRNLFISALWSFEKKTKTVIRFKVLCQMMQWEKMPPQDCFFPLTCLVKIGHEYLCLFLRNWTFPPEVAYVCSLDLLHPKSIGKH